MKKSLVTTTVLFLSLMGWSQYIIKSEEELQNLKKLPLEKVYVSVSDQLAFSGEYLYYGFHCFNAENSRASTISKVGYVALVNNDKEYIFEQKIKLDKGLGQGDFFVPTTLPSGNYKLLGYTQWMKNAGLSQVFKADIVIINPYLSDQTGVLPINGDTPKLSGATAKSIAVDSSTVGLVFDKTRFGTREKVSFSLKNYKGNLGHGSYTLKVIKKNILENLPESNSIAFSKEYLDADKRLSLTVGDSLFLPEQRGELLFGTVLDAKSRLPVKDIPVMVSLPGEEFVLKFATTDKDGNFYTYLRKDYKESVAIIQVDEDERDIDIKMKYPRKLDVTDLTFGEFTLNSELADFIKTRSVHNQIENQFFSKKPDSVLLGTPIDPFEGGIPEIFNLDEYTRFPTFQETLVEILNNAGYRNNPDGRDYIRINQDFETSNEAYNSFPAIVVFDGVLITNHETIKDFDARKIKTIKMIRDQFQLANKEYQGILSVETFEGNYYNDQIHNANAITAELIKSHPAKNYFTQSYATTSDFNRIPDYRTLLFWKPYVTVEGPGVDFEFFTSDIKGEYEVVVDGFTSYGKPISFKKSFMVSD